MTISAEIVEKIKRVLLDPEGATQGNLAKLALEYASNCRQLNANAERAAAMYRSGALSDSARILEEYSVFEEFRRLNFEGKEDWRAVCRTLGLEVAILPHAQIVEELRSFADVYERARDLFSEERRLALEGGSSARRLQILYALESTFPQYDIWKIPVKDLERKRVVEISNRLKETTKQNVDLAFVTSALEELEDAKRRSRAPEELLNALRVWKEYVERTDSLKRLRVLLEEWKKARESNDDLQELACLQYFRDADLSKATQLAAKEEIELLNALTQRAEIIERREKARAQLKRKSRELSRALETDSNADRLADLFASTELESDKAGEALDPSVTRAYRSRMETIETQRRRKRLALALFLILSAILFSAATALVVDRARTKRNVDEAVGAITSKLQDYESVNGRVEALAEAEEIVKNYEKTKPQLLRVPEYVQTVDRVKNLRTQEDQRLRQFDEIAKKILIAHNQNSPSPSLMDNLKGRCRTERDRVVYSKLKKKEQELIVQAEEAKANAYSQKLEESIDAVTALEESDNLAESETTAEISKIKQGIYELKQSKNGEETPEIKALTLRLEQIENRIKRASETEEETTQEETPDSESGAESELEIEPSVELDSSETDEDDAFDEALKTLEP